VVYMTSTENLRYNAAHREERRASSRAYYAAHREEIRAYGRKYMAYYYDWLYYQLGNRCAWCDRTSQEVELEADHEIGKIRLGSRSYPISETLRDLDNGDLRLLCVQCHKVRHSI